MTFLSVFDGICCAARCSVEKTDTARAVVYEKAVANDITFRRVLRKDMENLACLCEYMSVPCLPKQFPVCMHIWESNGSPQVNGQSFAAHCKNGLCCPEIKPAASCRIKNADSPVCMRGGWIDKDLFAALQTDENFLDNHVAFFRDDSQKSNRPMCA